MATEANNPSSNNPQHDKGDTALVRGARTGIQGFIGTIVTFLVGLVMAVWNVPGVPEALLNYVGNNLILVAAAVALPVGVVSFVWNLIRPNVKNW
jgi:hypothetical protein